MQVWRALSFGIVCRGRRSVQVSEIFMANIYAFHGAVNIRSLLKKGSVKRDIFEGTFLYLQ